MFKKLAAMLVGLVMAAMPLAGSVLADYTLADFPAPFVEGGSPQFLIIVGSGGTASGIAQDLSGLINVAARLGGETVTTEGAGAEVVTGGAKIESPGTDLTYDDKLVTVLGGAVKAVHLPDVLADGTYNGEVTSDADYDQEITFNANSPIMQMDIDEDDANEAAGTYLFINKDYVIYTYELDFEDDVEYDGTSSDTAEDDLVNTEIEILGKTYTISSVTVSSNQIDTITLLGGASEATVNDEETITVTLGGTEYEVTPSIYGDSSVTFTVEYDGNVETTDELDEGETDELADETEIGVRDILYSSKETKTSAVTFYLGAQSIELEDGNADIKLNGEKLDDYTAQSDFNDDSDVWNSLTITLQADDDIWIGEGEEWVDPLFGSWKLSYTGMTKTTEEFDWDSTGEDEATFTFNNINGDEVEMMTGLLDAGTDVVAWGDPDMTELYNNAGTIDATGECTSEAAMALANGDICGVSPGTGMGTALDDVMFLGISTGGECHVFQIEDVSSTQLKIRDLTLDKDLNDGDWIDEGTIDTAIGDLTIATDTDNITFTTIDLSGDGQCLTSLAGKLNFTMDTTDKEADITVNDGDDNADVISFKSDAGSSPVIVVDYADISSSNRFTFEEDSDKQIGIDNAKWGIMYTIADDTEDTEVTAEYPEEEVILNAYVLESSGTISGASGAGRTGVIKSNIAVVDTDVTSTQKSNYHLILGGGPAVNKLTAEALDLSFPTYGADSGIPEDGYMIQLVPDAFVEGQYALVIAGWEAEETTEAMSKVQANMAEVTGNTYYYPSAPAEEEEEEE
jgi:hypothetical protein